MKNKLTLIALALICGCTAVPDVADRTPWFVPETDLSVKAGMWETATVSQINSQGLLLYTALDPQGWRQDEKGKEDYQDSHDVADAPAWHGRFMASMALAMAADKKDRNDLLLHLTNGLLSYYEITSVPGLFGRSYLADYTGERIYWMETQEANPTKFWRQENSGKWWRTGLAKNHFLGAILGCGIPLALHENGKIQLRPDVKDALLSVMLPAMRRFVDNGFVIMDYDGKPTEFGDLRPNLIPKEYIELAKPFVGFFGISEEDLESMNRPLNGFNMILVLSMLRSAGQYDPEIMAVYEKAAKEWGEGTRLSLQVLGFIMKKIGHWKIDKPSYSDMEAVAFAATGLFLWTRPDGGSTAAGIEADVMTALTGLWGYMRYERNAAFSIPYNHFVDQKIVLDDVIEDLRDFPDPDQKVQMSNPTKDTDEVQPLANRKTNSHYWKSSPFHRVDGPGEPFRHPVRGSITYYSGQDFLVAYWLGRFFDLVPEK